MDLKVRVAHLSSAHLTGTYTVGTVVLTMFSHCLCLVEQLSTIWPDTLLLVLHKVRLKFKRRQANVTNRALQALLTGIQCYEASEYLFGGFAQVDWISLAHFETAYVQMCFLVLPVIESLLKLRQLVVLEFFITLNTTDSGTLVLTTDYEIGRFNELEAGLALELVQYLRC